MQTQRLAAARTSVRPALRASVAGPCYNPAIDDDLLSVIANVVALLVLLELRALLARHGVAPRRRDDERNGGAGS